LLANRSILIIISCLDTLISDLVSLTQYLDVGNSLPEVATLGEFTSNLQGRTLHELIFDIHPRVYEHYLPKETAEARGHWKAISFPQPSMSLLLI
jgi:hypothetical protein